jgi:hypothetical protein
LAQHRKTACICALFKAYMGEEAWKAISGRLQKSCHLTGVDHDRKIRNRKQRADIRKYSFTNIIIQSGANYLWML